MDELIAEARQSSHWNNPAVTQTPTNRNSKHILGVHSLGSHESPWIRLLQLGSLGMAGETYHNRTTTEIQVRKQKERRRNRPETRHSTTGTCGQSWLDCKKKKKSNRKSRRSDVKCKKEGIHRGGGKKQERQECRRQERKEGIKKVRMQEGKKHRRKKARREVRKTYNGKKARKKQGNTGSKEKKMKRTLIDGSSAFIDSTRRC